VQPTVEAVWRIESARLIAALARVTGDVGLAEDLAQDALVAALEQWPSDGVPDNPGAWLTAVARRRYIDGVRRAATLERKVEELGREARPAVCEDPMDEIEFDTHVEDDVLRLIFTACHPVLPRDGRLALTLKLVGGLSTEQVARAFLVPVPTMAARITRAKRALTAAKVPFEVPVGAELNPRFASVLEVVYLIFNEGYAATSGESWYRAELCDEAMRLGRMLSALAPEEPEAHGLVALMEIQASRIPARTGPDGAPVTLPEQNRARWNRLLITHGLAALAKAREAARKRSAPSAQPGPYSLQAELAACHARAATAADTDWRRIVGLYETLGGLNPSPVIELNRAVAVAMADSANGPAQALAIVDSVAGDPALRGYHLLPAVRGDLLARLGRTDQARREFERAAALTANDSERAHLLRRAADVAYAAASQANIAVRVDAPPVKVMADEERILQVLNELVTNAIKFSAPDTTIRLSAQPRGGDDEASPEVCFTVEDQGRGIAPEKLDRIFERFHQGDGSDSRALGGTGLGLALCRSIVQQQGGRIWAESTPGCGSRFHFMLPSATTPAH